MMQMIATATPQTTTTTTTSTTSNTTSSGSNGNNDEEELVGWGFRDPRLRPFVIISIAYLLFTVTDGALRMIVLLHAYNKSFSALEVAVMFSL
jgi:hypothetical protein